MRSADFTIRDPANVCRIFKTQLNTIFCDNFLVEGEREDELCAYQRHMQELSNVFDSNNCLRFGFVKSIITDYKITQFKSDMLTFLKKLEFEVRFVIVYVKYMVDKESIDMVR